MTLSPSITPTELAEVSPSKILISAVVTVALASLLSSAVVTVAPSRIPNSVPSTLEPPIIKAAPDVTLPVEVIAPEPTVPAKVTLAPEKVAAVVVPDLIIRLPPVLVRLPNVAESSLRKTSPPSALRIISVAASNVIVEPESISVITGLPLKVLTPEIVSSPPRVAKLSLCKAVLNSPIVPVSVPSPKSKVRVLPALSIVLFVKVSVVALPTSVSEAAGKITETSAVEAGPISLTLFEPLSLSS